MKIKNKSKHKFIKFLNGKAFYVVMGLCLVAVGVAAWAGVQSLQKLETNEITESQNNSTVSKNEILQLFPSNPLDTDIEDNRVESNDSDLNSTYESQNSSTDSETFEEADAPVATFFVFPVLGETIKDFSNTELQYSMTMQDMRLHKGIDIAVEQGTPVISSGVGTVTKVYSDAMLGTVIEIDHGNGIVAKYCGLHTKTDVKEKDTVDSTTIIGSVDIIPCESVEQRHLHLEFYKDGEAVSPLKYLGK